MLLLDIDDIIRLFPDFLGSLTKHVRLYRSVDSLCGHFFAQQIDRAEKGSCPFMECFANWVIQLFL